MSFHMSQSRDDKSAGGQEYTNGDQKKEGNTESFARKTILVCDDEADLLLMFRIHLESRYNVLTVDSGKACIDKLIDRKNKNEKVDLLLLDYKLRRYFRGRCCPQNKRYRNHKNLAHNCFRA